MTNNFKTRISKIHNFFVPLVIAMKSIQKIIPVCIAVAFLLSSLGFTINKMACLKSGKTHISFLPFKDCCPEKNSTKTIIKSPCCDINNISFKLNDFDPSQKSNIPVVDKLIFLKQVSVKQPILNTTTSKLSFADLPPPLHGRQLLSFISILII